MVSDDYEVSQVDGSEEGSLRKFRPLRAEWLSLVFDALIVWDFLTVSLAGFGCAAVYQMIVHAPPQSTFGRNAGQIVLLGGLLAAFVLRTRLSGGKTASLQIDFAGASKRVARGVVTLVCLLLAIGFVTRILDTVPRLWLVAWMITTSVAALGGRMLVAPLLRAAVTKGLFADRIAIIGSGPTARRLMRHVNNSDPCSGVRLIGTFSINEGGLWPSLDPLIRLSREHRVDRVILALPPSQQHQAAEIVERLKAFDVETLMYPDLCLNTDFSTGLSQFAGVPMVMIIPRPIRDWGLIGKTALDWTLSVVALAVLAPLMAAIALAIKLDSEGPVFFRQSRHGINNSEFKVWKFRTMRVDGSDSPGILHQTRRDDSRVTRVGRFLRGTSFDELPQLINVLNGSMSLVGPRPHAVVMRTENLLGEEIIASYPQRHRVRPGITGLAQVRGHRGATETALQVRQRVEHDIYYIENWSLLLDLKILFVTPFSVLFRRRNAF